MVKQCRASRNTARYKQQLRICALLGAMDVVYCLIQTGRWLQASNNVAEEGRREREKKKGKRDEFLLVPSLFCRGVRMAAPLASRKEQRRERETREKREIVILKKKTTKKKTSKKKKKYPRKPAKVVNLNYKSSEKKN